MTRRLNRWLMALIVVIWPLYYWLLLDTNAGNTPPKPIEMAQLRGLAGSIAGPAPDGIAMEMVAYRQVPGDLLAAGIGLKRRMIGAMAYKLSVPGHGPIIIDTGMSGIDADKAGMDMFLLSGQKSIDADMLDADTILLTHEHPDHAGGLFALAEPFPQILTHARLNPAQMPTTPLFSYQTWPRPVAPFGPVLPVIPAAVAPGVVTIPAPSHTPGSQMIYVRLANGREYLFTGDIATLTISWQQVRGRSRLLSQYLMPEDRNEIRAWLLTINKLKEQAPDMTIVPGHDYEWLVAEHENAGIVDGFANLK